MRFASQRCGKVVVKSFAVRCENDAKAGENRDGKSELRIRPCQDRGSSSTDTEALTLPTGSDSVLFSARRMRIQ